MLKINLDISFCIFSETTEVEWKSKVVQQESPVASSVYGGDYNKYSPVHASDGLLSILIMPDKIFSSSMEDSPWIRVDLWEISTIHFFVYLCGQIMEVHVVVFLIKLNFL